MEIIEISNKTEHPLKKQSSHSKRAGALQKERDVKQHKQQVLAGLAVSSHNHIRPIATSWDMDTPDLNEEEEAEDRRMDQQKRRLTRVKALDPRVEEIKRKFRASFRPVQSFPNNNIREQTISLSDPLRGRTAINPDYDDNFISVSQNHLNHTYPPRRSSPSAHPALRRRSDVSPPRDYTQATAMARVEKWVQAVGTPPTVATIGSGLGRSDVVTL